MAEPEAPGEEPGGLEITLSPAERRVLRELAPRSDRCEEAELQSLTGLPADTLRGALQRLKSKHLVQLQEEHTEGSRLTVRGREARLRGLPERRLLRSLVDRGGLLPAEELVSAAGLGPEERSVAIGVLRRRGFLEEGVPFRLRAGGPDPQSPLPEEAELERAASGGEMPEPATTAALLRRGLLEIHRESRRRWATSPEAVGLALAEPDRPLLGALTPAILRDGGWRGSGFRPYDVRARVPFRGGPDLHPFGRFLEEFAEILVGLGFEEAEGPLVETEFWNADVLYMPQEHPARSVHDVFFARGLTGHPPITTLLDRVRAVHEGRPPPGETEPVSAGWRVPYREEVARRPVLRSQTTAVSARYLSAAPQPPFRMFSLGRNFRPDAVDATHHIEFFQCEGILGEEGTSLRELIGVFRELAAAIGIRELKVRPSYFPFTEPSVEGYVRHPRLGWIEVFPGGILRPEVLRPLRVGVPVAAWGIGVTRLAMVALGVSDIRELFGHDLGRLSARGVD
ncbi:MAG: phenylalanine--tRNA ligase subunit alpha [Thermoplasmata archaeon]